MRDSTDAYIRQALKNWAAEQQPPENLRARLLLVAASGQGEQPPRNQSRHSIEGVVIHNTTPIDQVIQLHDISWLWVNHLSFAPTRQVT